MKNKQTIEESFENLDEIIDLLQNGDLTLEESFKKYEEGMKLVKSCSQSIDKVEKKLLVIGETQKNSDIEEGNDENE